MVFLQLLCETDDWQLLFFVMLSSIPMGSTCAWRRSSNSSPQISKRKILTQNLDSASKQNETEIVDSTVQDEEIQLATQDAILGMTMKIYVILLCDKMQDSGGWKAVEPLLALQLRSLSAPTVTRTTIRHLLASLEADIEHRLEKMPLSIQLLLKSNPLQSLNNQESLTSDTLDYIEEDAHDSDVALPMQARNKNSSPRGLQTSTSGRLSVGRSNSFLSDHRLSFRRSRSSSFDTPQATPQLSFPPLPLISPPSLPSLPHPMEERPSTPQFAQESSQSNGWIPQEYADLFVNINSHYATNFVHLTLLVESFVLDDSSHTNGGISLLSHLEPMLRMQSLSFSAINSSNDGRFRKERERLELSRNRGFTEAFPYNTENSDQVEFLGALPACDFVEFVAVKQYTISNVLRMETDVGLGMGLGLQDTNFSEGDLPSTEPNEQNEQDPISDNQTQSFFSTSNDSIPIEKPNTEQDLRDSMDPTTEATVNNLLLISHTLLIVDRLCCLIAATCTEDAKSPRDSLIQSGLRKVFMLNSTQFSMEKNHSSRIGITENFRTRGPFLMVLLRLSLILLVRIKPFDPVADLNVRRMRILVRTLLEMRAELGDSNQSQTFNHFRSISVPLSLAASAKSALQMTFLDDWILCIFASLHQACRIAQNVYYSLKKESSSSFDANGANSLQSTIMPVRVVPSIDPNQDTGDKERDSNRETTDASNSNLFVLMSFMTEAIAIMKDIFDSREANIRNAFPQCAEIDLLGLFDLKATLDAKLLQCTRNSNAHSSVQDSIPPLTRSQDTQDGSDVLESRCSNASSVSTTNTNSFTQPNQLFIQAVVSIVQENTLIPALITESSSPLHTIINDANSPPLTPTLYTTALSIVVHKCFQQPLYSPNLQHSYHAILEKERKERVELDEKIQRAWDNYLSIESEWEDRHSWGSLESECRSTIQHLQHSESIRNIVINERLSERLSLVATQWRKLWRLFRREAGPWHRLELDRVPHWKMDAAEDLLRRRMHLRPNYGFNSHEDARYDLYRRRGKPQESITSADSVVQATQGSHRRSQSGHATQTELTEDEEDTETLVTAKDSEEFAFMGIPELDLVNFTAESQLISPLKVMDGEVEITQNWLRFRPNNSNKPKPPNSVVSKDARDISDKIWRWSIQDITQIQGFICPFFFNSV